VLETHKPDRMLILGDTNSGLAAIVACRMGIPVFHLEAGNRSFDDRIPEEVNRRIIDHTSAILMPYTERSRMNLLREGISGQRVYVIGNPIFEVLEAQRPAIDASDVHGRLGLDPHRYLLVTMHRQENVDEERRLGVLIATLAAVGRKFQAPVLWPVHPRTRSKLAAFHIDVPAEVTLTDPLGFHDFVALERDALCALTDSGTVQEECSILRVPNVTMRDVTERPETIEMGSNIVAGIDEADVIRAVEIALASAPDWDPPPEYMRRNVSDIAARITLAHYEGLAP
jgi:UDP-N-acetylglucosamine 2-epimerase (non-hydrolysing)